MAFICPSKEDSERRREILCKLKSVVDKLTEQEGPVPIQMCPPPCEPCCRPCCPPCCCPCPCPPPTPVEQTRKETICKPPEIMVCYKIKKITKSGDKETKAKSETNEGSKLKQSTSRELRAGILYSGCDCEKLNGLQDDCRRSECLGSPACLTRPHPTCGPSEFSNGKHLLKKGRKNAGRAGGAGGGGSEGDGGKDAIELEEYQCFPAVLDTSHSCPC